MYLVFLKFGKCLFFSRIKNSSNPWMKIPIAKSDVECQRLKRGGMGRKMAFGGDKCVQAQWSFLQISKNSVSGKTELFAYKSW